MTQAELNKIIKNHQHWLKKDCDGWESMRADLAHANLAGANLAGADLAYANLAYANLAHANLAGVKIKDTFNIPFIPTVCPEKGSFIGFKKARRLGGILAIVELLIPEDAKRNSGIGRKCRCDKAKVLSITSLDGSEQYGMANSDYDRHFKYEVGKEVSVSDFCEDRFNECAAGIHFFINREEAVRY